MPGLLFEPSSPSPFAFFSFPSLPGLSLAFLFLDRPLTTPLLVDVPSVALSDLIVLPAEVDGEVLELTVEGCDD